MLTTTKVKRKKEKKTFPFVIASFPSPTSPSCSSVVYLVSNCTHFFHIQVFLTLKILWSPPVKVCFLAPFFDLFPFNYASSHIFFDFPSSLAPTLSHAHFYYNIPTCVCMLVKTKWKRTRVKKHKGKLQMKMKMELNDGKCAGWKMRWGDG